MSTMPFRKSIDHKIKESVLLRSFKILNSRDRKLLALVVVIQVMLGLLDLIGVALVGIIGALAVSGVQSQPPGKELPVFLNFLILKPFRFRARWDF